MAVNAATESDFTVLVLGESQDMSGEAAKAASPSRKAHPTTCPPTTSTSRQAASAVPPEASTSSTMSTRSPGSKASWWTWRTFSPYSRA